MQNVLLGSFLNHLYKNEECEENKVKTNKLFQKNKSQTVILYVSEVFLRMVLSQISSWNSCQFLSYLSRTSDMAKLVCNFRDNLLIYVWIFLDIDVHEESYVQTQSLLNWLGALWPSNVLGFFLACYQKSFLHLFLDKKVSQCWWKWHTEELWRHISWRKLIRISSFKKVIGYFYRQL